MKSTKQVTETWFKNEQEPVTQGVYIPGMNPVANVDRQMNRQTDTRQQAIVYAKFEMTAYNIS